MWTNNVYEWYKGGRHVLLLGEHFREGRVAQCKDMHKNKK